MGPLDACVWSHVPQDHLTYTLLTVVYGAILQALYTLRR